MKLKGSVLVGSLSGSSGDVTAFSWKGRQAIRMRVVPFNPQSDDQKLQRTAFTRSVECWQQFVQSIKDFLDVLGTARQMSGYNVAMSDAVHDERATHMHAIMPANRYLDPIASFAAAQGGASGTIALTWDAADWLVTDLPCVFYRKKNSVGDEYATPWTVNDCGAVKMNAATLTITGLTPGASYAVAMFGKRVAPDTLPALDYVYGGGDCKIQTAKS